MSANFVVVKNAEGDKKMVPFRHGAFFEDIFRTASREFGLDSSTHELRIGFDKIELNKAIEGSNIPKTTVLDIVPKLVDPSELDDSQISVELVLLDEGHQVGEVQKVMSPDNTLWDVVQELVPEWMRFASDGLCLSYMGTSYTGMKLRSIVLSNLCGNQFRLKFNCSRSYPLISNRNDLCSITNQPEDHRGLISTSIATDSNDIKMESLLSVDCSGVELKERKGRLFRQSDDTFRSVTKYNRSRVEESFKPASSAILAVVHFPNQLVAEAHFLPTEKIRDVMDFINGYLVDDAKNYYLYTIRPKLIADPNKRLQDMRSSPPGHLWFSGKKRDFFMKKVTDSLISRAFSSVFSRSEQSEPSYEKCSCHDSYFWAPSISNNKL